MTWEWAGWAVAAVCLGFALVARRGARAAEARVGELATCWSSAQKRADKLAQRLGQRMDAIDSKASAGPGAGRVGAMLAATSCEPGVSRAVRPERTPGEPMCQPCAARVVARGGHWRATTATTRAPCLHCGGMTLHRLAPLRVAE